VYTRSVERALFADIQGSFADIRGSFADIQGFFADIQFLLRMYTALLRMCSSQGTDLVYTHRVHKGLSLQTYRAFLR